MEDHRWNRAAGLGDYSCTVCRSTTALSSVRPLTKATPSSEPLANCRSAPLGQLGRAVGVRRGQITEEMKPIGNLDGVPRTLTRAIGIRASAVAADDLDRRMRL